MTHSELLDRWFILLLYQVDSQENAEVMTLRKIDEDDVWGVRKTAIHHTINLMNDNKLIKKKTFSVIMLPPPDDILSFYANETGEDVNIEFHPDSSVTIHHINISGVSVNSIHAKSFSEAYKGFLLAKANIIKKFQY